MILLSIKSIDFSFDGEVQATCSEPPYIWEWTSRSFGRKVIEVTAYDELDTEISNEFVIWKFF
jgi:hypothetical protein